MLDEHQKSRVLDELAFVYFTGNLRYAEQPDDEVPADTDDEIEYSV